MQRDGLGASGMQLTISAVNRQSAMEIVLSTASVMYIVCTVFWILPDCALRTKLISPYKVFWDFSGLHQRWVMFGAMHDVKNLHLTATIVYQDGMILFWEPPRSDILSNFDKFRLERFRKWDDDWIPFDKYKNYWPDLALYVARFHSQAGNRPVSFSLHMHSYAIPLPERGLIKRSCLPEHTEYSTIFTYHYSDQDFK